MKSQEKRVEYLTIRPVPVEGGDASVLAGGDEGSPRRVDGVEGPGVLFVQNLTRPVASVAVGAVDSVVRLLGHFVKVPVKPAISLRHLIVEPNVVELMYSQLSNKSTGTTEKNHPKIGG